MAFCFGICFHFLFNPLILFKDRSFCANLAFSFANKTNAVIDMFVPSYSSFSSWFTGAVWTFYRRIGVGRNIKWEPNRDLLLGKIIKVNLFYSFFTSHILPYIGQKDENPDR